MIHIPGNNPLCVCCSNGFHLFAARPSVARFYFRTETEMWISEDANAKSAVFPSRLFPVCSSSSFKEVVADLRGAEMTPPEVLIAPFTVVIFSDRERRRGKIASIEEPEMELQQFKSMKAHFCGRVISPHACRHGPGTERRLQPRGHVLQPHLQRRVMSLLRGVSWAQSLD